MNKDTIFESIKIFGSIKINDQSIFWLKFTIIDIFRETLNQWIFFYLIKLINIYWLQKP